MLRWVDFIVRHGVGSLLALIGVGFNYLSEWCIRAGAWIADIDWDKIEES